MPTNLPEMKRAWLCTLLLLAVPAAAAAQGVRVESGPSVPPPNPSPSVHHGVTVSALGVSHIDAATARVTLRLGSRTNAAIYNATVLAPVIDAMVQSGVDRASIEMPPNFQAPGNAVFATISGTAKNPTVDMMQRAVTTVGAAISAIPGAILQETQISLKADHCEAMQSDARNAAIALAHNKAVAIAKQLGVKLGSVTSVTSNDQAQPDGSCANSYSITPYSPNIEKPADYLSIPVYSSVTITYAIL